MKESILRLLKWCQLVALVLLSVIFLAHTAVALVHTYGGAQSSLHLAKLADDWRFGSFGFDPFWLVVVIMVCRAIRYVLVDPDGGSGQPRS